MSRASNTTLDALHGLLAGALKDELARAIELAQHEDEDKRKPINPQLLDKVMKFLKDNGIDAPGRANGPVADLADELAGINVDDDAFPHTFQ